MIKDKLKESLKIFRSKFELLLKKSDFLITFFLLLSILVALNYFSSQNFIRVDLTQDKLYSISDVSREAVSGLEDVLRIKVYFSQKLPNQYIGLEEEVNNILNEYVTYSQGKISLENIDPQDMENPETVLPRMGIPQMRFNVLERDSYQVTTGFMGVAVEYGQEMEVLPVVDDISNLEYQITTAIKKVTQEEVPVVGILSDRGSLFNSEEGLSTAREELERVYDLQDVSLEEEDIPEEVRTLLVIGPREKFDQEELEILDDFVMRGGSLFLFVDGIELEEGLSASQIETGLNDLVNSYGLEVGENLVLDSSSGRVSFDSGMFNFHTQYPPWVRVQEENLHPESVAVSGLRSLIFPWPSSVDTVATTSEDFIVLARTTSDAWIQEGEDYVLDPESDLEYDQEKTDQYKLAIKTNSPLKSAYSEAETEEGRVVLVGNSNFIRDDFLGGNRSGLVFFQNLVDSLSLDEDLITIRAKEITDRPLQEPSETVQAIVKYFNIFFLAVVVVVFGMVRYYVRKRRA